MRDNKWVRLLAYVTGVVNQRLLLQNEYLIYEVVSNRGRRGPGLWSLSLPNEGTYRRVGCGGLQCLERTGGPVQGSSRRQTCSRGLMLSVGAITGAFLLRGRATHVLTTWT